MMALTMHMVKTCDAYNKYGDVHDRTGGERDMTDHACYGIGGAHGTVGAHDRTDAAYDRAGSVCGRTEFTSDKNSEHIVGLTMQLMGLANHILRLATHTIGLLSRTTELTERMV